MRDGVGSVMRGMGWRVWGEGWDGECEERDGEGSVRRGMGRGV